MKYYLSFTRQRREQRNRIISGLIIAASISIAAVIGISIGAVITKSMGTLSIIKDESDALDTLKRKANHIVKDIREKNKILTGGIKVGFQQISEHINKTVKKV